jgi:hypothetical protein
MKQERNIKVGSVIQFPLRQFAPLRQGWNGWIFRAGIVEKLYISKSGKKCATVRYCSRIASRYQLLPNTEATTNVLREHLFQYDVDKAQKSFLIFRQYEKNGEQVCWDEDTALLLNHGIIMEEASI